MKIKTNSAKGYCTRCGAELIVDDTSRLYSYSLEDGEPLYHRPRVYCPRFICRLVGGTYYIDNEGGIQKYSGD